MTTTDAKPGNEAATSKEQSIAPAAIDHPEQEGHHPRGERSLRPFDAMLEDMDRLLGPVALLPFAHLTRAAGLAHAPRMDVVEKDHTLIVTAELPGARNEDVHVELRHGALIITGEVRAGHEAREHEYTRMERSYGRFYRRLPLPFEVNPDQIKATLKDGVLEVRIPEPPEAKHNRTAIPVS